MKIVDIIDQSLLEEQKKRDQRVRSGKYSPSSFGRCYRYQYWNRKNEKPSDPIDVKTLRVFKVGNLFHDFIQRFFEKRMPINTGKEIVGYTSNIEVKFETEDFIGFADIVLKDIIVDIKSIKSWGFKQFSKAGYNVVVDKESYILQLMAYVYFLGKNYGKLLFVEKDSLDIAEFDFKLDDWKELLLKEINKLKEIWKEDRIPEAQPRAYGGRECSYCIFRTKCGKEAKYVDTAKRKKQKERRVKQASNTSIW